MDTTASLLTLTKLAGDIACIWFAGNIREAVTESVRLNDVIKLEMGRADRYEAAWQRVVLEWGSKSEIRRVTGVSDGLIAMMRRVVKTIKRGNKTLKAKLPNLRTATWREARAAYLDLTPTFMTPIFRDHSQQHYGR
jgi:phage terminase large subunit-like protein